MCRRIVLVFVLLFLSQAALAQQLRYPEFAGVYLRVDNEFIELNGVQTYRGYILPPDRPSEYRTFSQFGMNNFLGTTISSNNALFLSGAITLQDYAQNLAVLPTVNSDTVISIVTVQRPPFDIGRSLVSLAGVNELLNSFRALTQAEQAQCAENEARSIAPLAGGFNICRAREFAFEHEDVAFIDAYWGFNIEDNTRQRFVDANTTEYLLDIEPTNLCNSRTMDFRRNRSLPNYGYGFTASNGLTYMFACRSRAAETGYASANSSAFEDLFELVEGDYAIHPGQCRLSSREQPDWVWQVFGPRPLSIDTQRLSYDHSICDIQGLQRAGQEHIFDLSCVYGEARWSERLSVTPRADGRSVSFAGYVLRQCPQVAWNDVAEPDFEMPIRAGVYSNVASGCGPEPSNSATTLDILAPADVGSGCHVIGYHELRDTIELVTTCGNHEGNLFRFERLSEDRITPYRSDEVFQRCPFEDFVSDDSELVVPISSLLAPNGSMWVQLASRATLRSAQGFVASHAPEARIFQSDNGWYAIVATRLEEGEYDTLASLIANRGWPDDSLLTRGENFVAEFPSSRVTEGETAEDQSTVAGSTPSDSRRLIENLQAEHPDFYSRLSETIDDERLGAMLGAMELNINEDLNVVWSSPVYQEMLEGFIKVMLSPGVQRLMESIGFPDTQYIYAFEFPDIDDAADMSIEFGLDYAFELGIQIIERGLEDHSQPWDGTSYEAFFDAAIPASFREAKFVLTSMNDYQQGNYVSLAVGVFSEAAGATANLYEAWTVFSEVNELNRSIVEDARAGAIAVLATQQAMGIEFQQLSFDFSRGLARISEQLMTDSQAWTVDAGRKLRIISELLLIRALQLERRDVSGHVETFNRVVSDYEGTPISVLDAYANVVTFGAAGTREYTAFSQVVAEDLELLIE